MSSCEAPVERKGFGTQLLEGIFDSDSACLVVLTFERSGRVFVFSDEPSELMLKHIS